jgi:amino acid adenylation domain-containing protein
MDSKSHLPKTISPREGELLLAHSIDSKVSADSAPNYAQLHALTGRGPLRCSEIISNGPSPRCLHTMFEAQVERTPENIAVVYNDEALSYEELNEWANQVAHYLRQQGVGPETYVGLLMDRSLELVVGLLAILKAGGAYVPLDSEYPPERLRFMLDDAQVHLILTQERPRRAVSTLGARVVCLDADGPAISAMSGENPAAHSCPDTAAYVIYTSGSTGRPKGVVVTHANIVRLFQSTEEWFHFGAADVWTMFHSAAFDFSVWETWGALLYGGRLVVVPYWESRTPDRFYKLLELEEVTVLNQTPSAFRQLMLAEAAVADSKGPSLPALRVVIFGGEALEMQSLSEWFARHAETRPEMINMYGITETTVHVTYRPIGLLDVSTRAGSMIGRPLADLQLYVLDEQLRPSPLGVAGELYVGGAGLARGYLNRPELTAERFVPHPFSAAAGARLYRSGDVGRWTADGDLEYLGRIDEQVKVRGFRIELGEIQAALAAHPALGEVVVVLRTEPTGEKLLVAYFGARPGTSVPLKELRRYLQERLPDYMIPAAFVQLERLPLTAHGKVDRRALPAPDSVRPELGETYVAPRNEVEEALAAVWARVLRVERVGVYDNFFDLGGDSVRSVQVVALAKESGLFYSVQQLFQKQTIAMLAAEVNMVGTVAATPRRCAPFSLISPEDRQKLPRDVEDAYPLAMMQAGMLYHMAYMPDQIVYHNVYSYHIRARCDVEVLREVLCQVTANHPILRTSFDLSSYDEPLQLVHKKILFPLAADDISHLSTGAQEEALDAFFESEKWRRFELSSPPLLRFHIHRRTAETFNLTMSECHPVFDGWSLHSLLAEIFTRYFALLKHAPAPNYQPLSSTYSDFVKLEREALASEECRRFWLDKLRGATPVEVPRWTAALPVQAATARIRNLPFPLSDETSQALKQLARNLKVPLRTVLLTAHLKVMSMISGQTDVLTGMVSVGRPEEADGERILGLFFNTLPFRLALPPATTWADLIQQAFAAEVEILPHRRYPTAMLQKQWGRKPLFETIFNYLHFNVIDDLLASGDLKVLDADRAWEETNLTFSTAFILAPLTSQLMFTLRYDTRRFHEAQIRGIGEYYKHVIEVMLAAPDRAHSAQCLLSEREQRRLLSEWNDTQTGAQRARCVHRLFEEQVEKNPAAVAAVAEDEELTYSELNERANQLAHHLLALGVAPEVPVGIYLGRSLATLVCMLGVMKAGGAYVALDPAYPRAELAAMLDEARVQVLLTQQSLLTGLPECAATVVCIDTDRQQISAGDTHNPRSRATAENLVCLYFTSGSTGRSKGVAVEHRQLSNYTNALVARLQLPAGLSYAMVSPFHTDLGNTMIFPALTTGGALHIIAQHRISDGQALAAYFARHPPDCLKIVPSHLAALLAASAGRDILPRRRLILGGEAVDWSLIDNINQRRHADCVVFNHYGPTETTVGVLTCRLASEPAARAAATPPLGRPLDNSQVYLLDANLHPVPVATPGELYVGGVGLARGYINRPDLTAEKFIPNPFSAEPGARLYSTGDRARHLPDGNIEFLGRVDHQVKIRGFRIELQAIEAALREHPLVRQAVALVSEAAPGMKQLVAYVVPDAGRALDIADLRGHMKQLLPTHMLPTAFVVLDELPLAPNGKLDRSALPDKHAATPLVEDEYVAPQSEVERIIKAIWQETLQVDRVGTHDNFFDVGGHSFVMLQIQSKLQTAFDKTISIIEMFEHPTISSLAEHLAAQAGAAPDFQAVQQQAEARRESLLRRRGLQPQPAQDQPGRFADESFSD